MKKFNISFLAFCFFSLSIFCDKSFANDSGERFMDAKEFMEKVKGTYQIISVNGKDPHSANKAEIAIEDLIAADWAMPYCIEKVCIPGFMSFPFEETKIVESCYSSEEKCYTIQYNNLNYYWIEKDNEIYFRNPQFQLPNSQAIALEYKLVINKDSANEEHYE